MKDSSLSRHFSSRILRLQAPYQQGWDVYILQSLLNLLPDNIIPHRLEVDSILGPETRKAVICFQKYFGLRANGIVAADTFYALGHLNSYYSRKQPVFSSRRLGLGDSGPDVKILQNRLAAYTKTSLNRPAHGKFDIYTAQAVKRLQDDFDLKEEEVRVGPATFAVVFLNAPLGGRVLSKGRHGLDCYYLQMYLHSLGYYNYDPDGFFSTITRKALISFQKDAGIRADGIASAQTYLALGNSMPFPRTQLFYQTQAGDSCKSISDLFKLPIKELNKINNLNSRQVNKVKPGKVIQIPAPQAWHLLKSGDNPEQLANYYDLNVNSFIKANRVQLSQGIVPGESLILPGYQLELKGYIIYLNKRGNQTELKSLNLEKMESSIIHIFDQPDVDYLQLKDKEIHIGSNSCRWKCNYSIMNENLVLTSPSRSLPYKFKLPPNDQDLKSVLKAVAKKRVGVFPDQAKALEEPGLPLAPERILHYQFSPDGSHLLIFVSQQTDYGTVAYLFNLPEEKLQIIGENEINGVFSTDGKQFLMLSRSLYGARYPWFFNKIRLFNIKGSYLGDEIESREALINNDCFDRTSSFFTFIMHRPNIFYPLPVSKRDIYVKKLNSQLLFQITAGENAYCPVWI